MTGHPQSGCKCVPRLFLCEQKVLPWHLVGNAGMCWFHEDCDHVCIYHVEAKVYLLECKFHFFQGHKKQAGEN